LQSFPNASIDDCRRFAADFGRHHAAKRLGKYLAWKATLTIPKSLSDAEKWKHAAHGSPLLSQMIFFDRIVYLVPAQIDVSLSMQIYVDVFSSYLEQVFTSHASSTLQTYTFIMDARPGHGWKNPSPLDLVAWIRHVAKALAERFPGRLDKCIVVPVPKAAMIVHKLLRPFLQLSAVQLFMGSADIDAALPDELLRIYPELHGMEVARQRAFL
jgi:hypothetical protein